MKKKFLIFAVIGLFVVGAIVGFMLTKKTNQESFTNEEPKQEVEVAKELDVNAIEILGKMTLEQKVGQMMIVRNEYASMTPEYEAEILALQPGGYIIFDKNITTLENTKQLINDVREEIEIAGSVVLEENKEFRVPAIMSVDQEGGLVQRLQAISDYPPKYIESMGEIGATGSLDVALETGRLIGEECKSVGLNVDFAPVADIFSNPENTVIGDRAFGTDKETVANMATAVARGISEEGVVPSYKHFPGHGDTKVDSHQALPVVTKTIDELMKNELYPFQKAIESGAKIIMVAHIALPNVTGDYTPASLSYEIITGILKSNMNYQGLVITDGLDMGALTENYSNGEIAVKAVLAGADILLTPVSPSEAKTALIDAVKNGTISEARIDESVLKILELKLSLTK